MGGCVFCVYMFCVRCAVWKRRGGGGGGGHGHAAGGQGDEPSQE